MNGGLRPGVGWKKLPILIERITFIQTLVEAGKNELHKDHET
jgi:hypothetical protein